VSQFGKMRRDLQQARIQIGEQSFVRSHPHGAGRILNDGCHRQPLTDLPELRMHEGIRIHDFAGVDPGPHAVTFGANEHLLHSGPEDACEIPGCEDIIRDFREEGLPVVSFAIWILPDK